MVDSARTELLERLKLAHAEYRAEVALGWDRQKLVLLLNPALTVGLATTEEHTFAVRLACVAAAIVAIAGALIVQRSHGRYQAARAALQRLEDQLWSREARDHQRLEQLRIGIRRIAYAAQVAVFLLLVVVDLVLAVNG